MRITIERYVDAETASTLLVTHNDTFRALDDLAAEKQSLDEELFLKLLDHPDVIMFVGWDDDGEPIALMMVTSNLGLIPWVQASFYASLYPEHAARNAIFYVPTLHVVAAHQGGPMIKALCEAFALWIVLSKGVLAFDTCKWDIDNIGVPQFIERYALAHIDGVALEVDSQHYFAYEAVALKSLDLRDRTDHGIVIDLAEPTLERTGLSRVPRR